MIHCNNNRKNNSLLERVAHKFFLKLFERMPRLCVCVKTVVIF